MTIALYGSNGAVFPTLGRIAGLYRTLLGQVGDTDPYEIIEASNSSSSSSSYTDPQAHAYWGLGKAKIKSLGTGISDIFTQLAAATALKPLTNNLYSGVRDPARNSFQSTISALQALAQNVLVELVNADVTLTQKQLKPAMVELIRQMGVSTDTVTKNTVSAAVTAYASNVGSAVMAASLIGPDGKTRETVFPETAIGTVMTDAQGNATAGSESITVLGDPAAAGVFAYNWPQGSGASVNLTVCDPTIDNGLNLLTNSDFENAVVTSSTFNASTSKWDLATVGTGTAGTSILTATGSNAYRGSNGVAFVGDGSELTAIGQKFNNSAGTLGRLLPSTVYAGNVWIKMSATPAAGVLSAQLCDGTGTVITDNASVSQTVAKSLTGVSTSWVSFTFFLRTPAVLPASGLFIRLKLTTALTSGRTLYFDDLALCPATEFYTGGPFLAAFRGLVDAIVADYWSIVIANDLGGVWQQVFEQLFGMRSMGLLLPSASAGSSTVASNLAA